MKKQLIAFVVAASLFVAPQTFAAEPTPAGCQPIYNGGTTCANNSNLTINKKVLKPGVTITPGQSFKDSDFIENIGPNDPGYPVNTLTAFRIYVTNSGRSTLKNITVKDILPPRYVTFVSGNNGSYDDASRSFTATISELKSKATQTFTIQVMTARSEELPTDGSSLCTINMALASVNDQTSQDTAQLCVSRNAAPTQFAAALPQTTKGGLAATPTPKPTTKGTPVTPGATTKGGLPVVSPVVPQPGQNTPSTGPESLVLAGLLPTGALGWLLRRKTS
jgi:uncharacterized repeat protein (TIGR01451 family)